MLFSDDVFEMKRQKIEVGLVQLAIFAAAAYPLPDVGPKSGVHRSPRRGGKELAGLGLEDCNEGAVRNVLAVFGFLVRGEQSLVMAVGQVAHTGLQC